MKEVIVMNSKAKKWQGKADVCNICGDSLSRFPDKQWFVDGRMDNRTTWALMCPECFEAYGAGLGEGLGQKYHIITKEKIAG